ncbi:MAG: FHA domain-containing protein [Candidatus Methylomirabilota bacterium]
MLALGVAGGAMLPGPGLSAPLDVVLVLDQSGSMKQNDPQRLLAGVAGDFVSRLGGQDAAGLVLFGGQAKAIVPLTLLGPEANRRAVLDAIQRIRYSDPWTNIAAGIERGLYEVKEHGRTQAAPILICITDGIVDTGSEARNAEMRDWLRTRLLPDARERGVKIFGVALTEQADYALIQEMAGATGGDYFRALGVQEIAGIFERISRTLQAPPPAPAAPRPSGASPPSPPAPPAPILTMAWVWIPLLGALLLMLVGGVLALRRSRPSGAPAGGAAASPPTVIGKALSVELVPEAFLRDDRTGKRIRLGKLRVRIGRAADNDVVLPEPQVSSHHAEIEYRQGRFLLRDLRSTNGTWVNRSRVQDEVVLAPGDTVAFDEFAFIFTEGEAAEAGTMVREPDGRAVPAKSSAPRAAEPPAFSGTVVIGTDATLGDATGPSRCLVHSSLEATERCDSCGMLCCALCIPPGSGTRVCRSCRDRRNAAGGRPGTRPDAPTAVG